VDEKPPRTRATGADNYGVMLLLARFWQKGADNPRPGTSDLPSFANVRQTRISSSGLGALSLPISWACTWRLFFNDLLTWNTVEFKQDGGLCATGPFLRSSQRLIPKKVARKFLC